MLGNYLTVAVRAFARQKAYTLVNVSGLAVGFASCLMILLFVRDELSYDRFHENGDRIVRVLRESEAAGELQLSAVVLGELAPQLEQTFSGVERAVRVHRRGGVLSNGADSYEEPGFAWADSDFFDVFSFELIHGNAESVLSRPATAVVTEHAARRYFGDVDAIGQMLRLNDRHDLEVTGVVANPPSNSHLDFEVLASFSTLGDLENTWAPENQGWTYLLLAPGQSPGELETQIAASLDDLVWWWNLDAFEVGYKLQAITDIHLRSTDILSAGDVGNERNVYLFSIIAALVLTIAAINYMNLATARAARREREVGLRKAVGARRGQLVVQFMSESVLISGVSLLLAVAIVLGALPWFNAVTGKALSVNVVSDLWVIAAFVAVAAITGLTAGIYPAALLSGFRPARVLKGMRDRSGSPILRKGLVVLQFGITIVLLAGTAVVYQQMRFIQHRNLGFDSEQVVTIDRRGLDGETDAFKQALLGVPGVVSVSSASGVPTLQGGWVSDSEIDGEKIMTMRLLVDGDYASTLGLQIVEGRDIYADRESDRREAVLVNEAMVNAQGWTDPLVETVGAGADSLGNPVNAAVVGVVRDFDTGSMHTPVMPAIIDPNPKWAGFHRQFVVRLAPGDISGTLESLESTWRQFVPAYPFKFSFVDDAVDALYRAEQRFGRIFAAFTLLAVLVACLGLYGLAAFSAEQRTKEIGIRKVLGARVSGLVALLSKEFVKLVAVAFAIAAPVAYILMGRWLDDFAYRIELSPGLFLVVGLGAAALAILTVSYQAIRAATADPVRTLRYE